MNLLAKEMGGSNNDAYLDAAYLNVTSVPVPAAVWLFGSGLIGLIGLRGKLTR